MNDNAGTWKVLSEDEYKQLQAENAALRARVARLENLAKVVENYLEGDSDAEYLYVALKALEAGGEGGASETE